MDTGANPDELTRRLRSGDEEAFGEFTAAYEKQIYNYCLRQTRNAEDAEDLTQEVFLRAWRGLPNFAGRCTLRTWLYQIAVNTCVDLARKKARRPVTVPLTVETDGEEQVREIPDTENAPETILSGKMTRESIRKGLEALGEEQRRIVILRDISGLSYQEIADTLGITEGTVKSRLSRARGKLAGWLIKNGNIEIAGNLSSACASAKTEGK